MECFQVLEAGEGIEAAVLRGLTARGVPRGGCSGENQPALLVVSPRAASAVSYGVSPRDSLTISSREGDTLWAALQRELVTVDGRVVERQEFPLVLAPGEEELAALAAAGALLLLGVPPEEVGTALT